jgi:hypothetical protein
MFIYTYTFDFLLENHVNYVHILKCIYWGWYPMDIAIFCTYYAYPSVKENSTYVYAWRV